MPAQAGIQGKWRVERHKAWIPAFAGKTEKNKVDFKSTPVKSLRLTPRIV
jgi:hypothetical protein